MKKITAEDLGLGGLGTALITPFRNGAVDCEAYRRLLERQIRGEVDFLVPLGTTGETPCLDDGEKIRILELTAENAHGKTVVAGVGTNSLTATVNNIKVLENHGVDVFLVVVPYYNKPTQKGQYEYFKAVAGETDRPIILYNVPGRTGANMKAETTVRLAEDVPNIVAVKEASGNLEQIHEILAAKPEGFDVLSGNDDQTLDIMRHGGRGVISVASNIAPSLMRRFISAITEMKWEEAEALNARLMPLFNACFMESNPIPAKAALAAMGLIAYELRLPLCPGEVSTTAAITKVVRDLDINE